LAYPFELLPLAEEDDVMGDSTPVNISEMPFRSSACDESVIAAGAYWLYDMDTSDKGR
jgi:hypothetical protein